MAGFSFSRNNYTAVKYLTTLQRSKITVKSFVNTDGTKCSLEISAKFYGPKTGKQRNSYMHG